MKKKANLFKILIILLLVITGELFFLKKVEPQTNIPLAVLADQILEKCASSSYHPTCYEDHIPALMDAPNRISMEQAFEVTKLVQGKDRTFPYCHVLGHKLSQKEVQKDESKWKDVVSRCPSGLCSNGCIHGGFQERFRAESFTDEQIEDIKPDLKTICEKRDNWSPTGMEQASCYHALGHLTMYLTSADINRSIKLCEEISIKDNGRDYSHLCFDGAFMQIYQPLEPEDFALIKGKEQTKETVGAFCSNYDGTKRGSCISESWPLFRQEIKSDPKQLINFCSKLENKERDRCYSAMIYVLTPQFNFDEEKIGNYCKKIPKKEVTEICFANAASRMIETDYRYIDKAVGLCTNASNQDSQNACFKELLKFSTYNFKLGSEDFYKLCNGLPDPWKTDCLNQI